MKSIKERFKDIGKQLVGAATKPEMRILPGQLAFFFVLSIIPLIALVGGIASLFSLSMDTIKEFIIKSVPGSASTLLLSIVSGKGLNFNMIIFFASAFVLASNGTHSMIIASNQLYKTPDSNLLKRRIKAILMTFILVLLLIFVLLVPAFGDFIFNIIRTVFHGDEIVLLIYKLYQILKYPLSIFLIYFNIKLLYTIAPDVKIKSSTTTYGAIFTTITWIIATEIYSVYVEIFAKYDIFYGSISNILILLLWVYVLAYVFVLGMAINTIHNEEVKK